MEYPLSILAFLLLLERTIEAAQVFGQVAGRIWIEYPQVKESVLLLGPITTRPDIRSSIIIGDGRPTVEGVKRSQ